MRATEGLVLMSLRIRLLLCIIPAIILSTGVAMYLCVRPFYAGLLGFDYDPAYAYLMNGVGILHGYAPRHVDHPGTPVQFLCAGVTFVIWSIAQLVDINAVSLDLFVQTNPEFILSCISFVFLTVHVTAVYYIGAVVYRTTDSLQSVALIQTSSLLLNSSFFHVMYVNGEAASICASLFLLGVVLRETFDSEHSDNNRNRHWIPFLVGLLLAIAVTSKVTFAPYILLLFSMGSSKRILTSFLYFLATVLVILIPVRLRIKHFIEWIYRITVHSGYYGTGSRGYVDIADLPHHFLQINEDYSFSIACLGVIIVLFVLHRGASPAASNIIDGRRRNRLLGLLLTASVLSAVIALKHYQGRYAIPMALLTGTILLVVLHQYEAFGYSTKKKHFYHVFLGAISVSCLIYYVNLFISLSKAYNSRVSELSAIETTISTFPNPVLVGDYRVPNLQYATQFGLSYVAREFAWHFTGGAEDQISYDSSRDMIVAAGYGLKDIRILTELAQNGRPVLLLLPEGATVSGVSTNLILRTPSGLRLFQVTSSESP